MFVVIPMVGRKDSPVLQGWNDGIVEAASKEAAIEYAAKWMETVDKTANASIQKLHVAEVDDNTGLIKRTLKELYSFQRKVWMAI